MKRDNGLVYDACGDGKSTYNTFTRTVSVGAATDCGLACPSGGTGHVDNVRNLCEGAIAVILVEIGAAAMVRRRQPGCGRSRTR